MIIGSGNASITDTNWGSLAVNAIAVPTANAPTLADFAAETMIGLTGNLVAPTQQGSPATPPAALLSARLRLETGELTLADAAVKTIDILSSNLVVFDAATITVNATGSGPRSAITGNTTILDNGGGAMTVNDANASGSGYTVRLSRDDSREWTFDEPRQSHVRRRKDRHADYLLSGGHDHCEGRISPASADCGALAVTATGATPSNEASTGTWRSMLQRLAPAAQ